MVHCHADCSNAANWSDESRLTTPSFDIDQAPAARGPFGYFLGEYEGLTNIGNVFVPVFVGVNNGNPANRTDVFAQPPAEHRRLRACEAGPQAPCRDLRAHGSARRT